MNIDGIGICLIWLISHLLSQCLFKGRWARIIDHHMRPVHSLS